ncbi:MAG TPA: hypothetical protein VMS22_15700 [Candidatus Eisenbacteria bacterium]|nr:hypothetical protein [Candidatus Eisenbacteria bacterium]
MEFALALALILMVVHGVSAVTPFTRVDTQTSPSFTSIWVPPASFEASEIRWPVTITPQPGGVTEAKVSGSSDPLVEFFGPGLSQYFLSEAGIYGVARAEFGVLRAYAYAFGGVAPKAYGAGFVLGTNSYAALARAIMRPQFTDVFTAPATPGAPNPGNAQVLTGQIVLDGSLGGTGSATWLISMDIVSDTQPPVSVYHSMFYTSGCGGPCPFPLSTFAVDVATTVGTTYIIYGDLGITANAGGSALSSDTGFQVSAIDAANTGKFFVRVKETGEGIIGQSGHDYGAPVPPGTIPIPTTTTLKLPPDMPTTTTTTITEPGATTTTTTTLPAGGTEQCDNCVDDDGNGLVDAEDPSCCATSPLGLTLRNARLLPGTAGTALRMTATVSGAAALGLDPTLAGVTLQLRDPAIGAVLCGRLAGSAFARKKKGKLFAFRDPAGAAHGLTGASLRTGKRDVSLAVDGKSVQLDTLPDTALQVTVTVADPSGRRCISAPPATLRKVGKKGTLRFP